MKIALLGVNKEAKAWLGLKLGCDLDTPIIGGVRQSALLHTQAGGIKEFENMIFNSKVDVPLAHRYFNLLLTKQIFNEDLSLEMAGGFITCDTLYDFLSWRQLRNLDSFIQLDLYHPEILLERFASYDFRFFLPAPQNAEKRMLRAETNLKKILEGVKGYGDVVYLKGDKKAIMNQIERRLMAG